MYVCLCVCMYTHTKLYDWVVFSRCQKPHNESACLLFAADNQCCYTKKMCSPPSSRGGSKLTRSIMETIHLGPPNFGFTQCAILPKIAKVFPWAFPSPTSNNSSWNGFRQEDNVCLALVASSIINCCVQSVNSAPSQSLLKAWGSKNVFNWCSKLANDDIIVSQEGGDSIAKVPPSKRPYSRSLKEKPCLWKGSFLQNLLCRQPDKAFI